MAKPPYKPRIVDTVLDKKLKELAFIYDDFDSSRQICFPT